MDPVVSLHYYAPVCAIINACIIPFTEGLEPFYALHRVGLLVLFTNAGMAFALNVSILVHPFSGLSTALHFFLWKGCGGVSYQCRLWSYPHSCWRGERHCESRVTRPGSLPSISLKPDSDKSGIALMLAFSFSSPDQCLLLVRLSLLFRFSATRKRFPIYRCTIKA